MRFSELRSGLIFPTLGGFSALTDFGAGGLISLQPLELSPDVPRISEPVCIWHFGHRFTYLSFFYETVDGPLKDSGKWLTEITVSMFVKLAAVVFMTPIFLVPGVIVGAFGGWIGQIYMAAQLSVKREMSNAKSPVVGQYVTCYIIDGAILLNFLMAFSFGAAIAGLSNRQF
jgi:hypothetical protein